MTHWNTRPKRGQHVLFLHILHLAYTGVSDTRRHVLRKQLHLNLQRKLELILLLELPSLNVNINKILWLVY